MSEHLFNPASYTTDESNPCVDCGGATTPNDGPWEYYMVHDSVWLAAGMKRGMLCIGCLELRLDRQLVPQDFPYLRINELDPWDSTRLRARKRGLPLEEVGVVMRGRDALPQVNGVWVQEARFRSRPGVSGARRSAV
jgi:hypothetical protein